MTREYLRGEERRDQIVDATLRLVSRHGVKGATLNRIAAEVGISTPALYGHYGSRRDILVDAMRSVFEQVQRLHRSSANPNALERLREISLAHTQLVQAGNSHLNAFIEFIAAPPDDELRDLIGAMQLASVEELADIVREGQRQGTVRPEVDASQIAWMLACRAWTEDLTSLMNIGEHFNEGRSKTMLDHIIDFIAARSSG